MKTFLLLNLVYLPVWIVTAAFWVGRATGTVTIILFAAAMVLLARVVDRLDAAVPEPTRQPQATEDEA